MTLRKRSKLILSSAARDFPNFFCSFQTFHCPMMGRLSDNNCLQWEQTWNRYNHNSISMSLFSCTVMIKGVFLNPSSYICVFLTKTYQFVRCVTDHGSTDWNLQLSNQSAMVWNLIKVIIVGKLLLCRIFIFIGLN